MLAKVVIPGGVRRPSSQRRDDRHPLAVVKIERCVATRQSRPRASRLEQCRSKRNRRAESTPRELQENRVDLPGHVRRQPRACLGGGESAQREIQRTSSLIRIYAAQRRSPAHVAKKLTRLAAKPSTASRLWTSSRLESHDRPPLPKTPRRARTGFCSGPKRAARPLSNAPIAAQETRRERAESMRLTAVRTRGIRRAAVTMRRSLSRGLGGCAGTLDTVVLPVASSSHSPGTPFSLWIPREAKLRPEPATRSLTVL